MKPYYDDGEGHQIFHGDSRDVAAELQPGSVDCVVTDPPYGMEYCGSFHSRVTRKIRGDIKGQGPRILRGVLHELSKVWREGAHIYIFCHYESYPDFYDAIGSFAHIRNALIWSKECGGTGALDTAYAKDYEIIVYAADGKLPLRGRRDGCVLTGVHPPPPKHRTHPTEKPVVLLKYLIEKSTLKTWTVCDPFCGSGATLVAAKESGRKCIGIEVEEAYCEAAAIRLAAAARKEWSTI